MSGLADFFINPTVIVAVFVGGCVLLLVYILKLFKLEHDAEERNQSEQVSSTSERKKESSSGKQKKKQVWTRSADKQNFNNTWIFKTLKSHTGQVLNIDYSSSGKYLASCGEEDPEANMNRRSSGSNKENTRPPSANSSPQTQGLSRRQRKNNRKREDSPLDSKKKFDLEPAFRRALAPKKIDQNIKFDPNSLSEATFVTFLQRHVLTFEQLFNMGYPDQYPECRNYAFFYQDTRLNYSNGNNFKFNNSVRQSRFNVNAREFVPRRNSAASDTQSSESSENDSEESSGSDLGYSVRESMERTCARCSRGFKTKFNEYLTKETCTYHWGRLHMVHSGDETEGIASLSMYTCCRGEPDSAGCTTCKLHVWNGAVDRLNGPFQGYVKTRTRKRFRAEKQRVFAMDCEMCYTVAGLEATKVTVVDMQKRIVYEAYVKPENEIVDYNTRFSGITAEDLEASSTKSLGQVQNDLANLIHANSILIGHGLENDLRALKMVHKTVVDTSASYPHYHGFPYKRALKGLVFSFLKRQVQCGTNGHDSYEDACACMDLMLYKVREENSSKYM